MKIAGVYKFTNKNNNKVYIGSSIDINHRYNEHMVLYKSNRKKGCVKFYKALFKYGKECFDFEIIELIDKSDTETFTEFVSKIRICEQHYLDLYYAKEHIITKGKDKRFRNLTYNINPKAEGGGGNFWSKERKEKLKLKYKTEGHTCLGRIISEETRKKISNTKKENGTSKGKNNPNYGITCSEEKKQNMRTTYFKNNHKTQFIAIKNGIVYGPYNFQRECAKKLNIDRAQIRGCLKNNPKYKTAKGYTFKYIENNES